MQLKFWTVATLYVTAPLPATPNWLLFMLRVVTTAPEFITPWNKPVALDVVPFIILLFIFSTPGAEELMIPIKSFVLPTPVLAQLTIVLLVILTVAVNKAVRPAF